MSDERNDDEILGRALARAVETQDARETPYERSRLAVHPLRRGLVAWQFAGAAAAALVVVLAFGAWLTRPSQLPPVAASPTATAAPTTIASASPTPTAPPTQPLWVYFTRDSLPPIGANVAAYAAASGEARIVARIVALHGMKAADVPSGLSDPLAQVAPSVGGAYAWTGVGATIAGDLATVRFDLPNGWGVTGPSQARQLVQQIVYTVTEESGVRRVLIVDQHDTTTNVGGLVLDRPLSRDDVTGYTTLATTGTTTLGGNDKPGAAVGATLVSRDIQDGTLVRLTFEGHDRANNDATADLPTTKVTFAPNDGSMPHNVADGPQPAYVLTVGFQWNGTGSSGGVGHVERVDRSPLRLIAGDFNTSYQLGLDDARPWRAYMPDARHLVVEIGGDPRLVSDRIAVYTPDPGAAVPNGASAQARAVNVTGSARVFEANVVWRLVDAARKTVATGHTTASLGTSLLWGTFGFQLPVPAGLSGNVTLELYEVSAKDGTEQGTVSIPLVVR